MFAVHTLVAEENAMDAEKAFVTLTVLNILNKAQAFLPFSIHSVVQVRWQGGEAVLEEPCRGVAGCAGARKRSRERGGHREQREDASKHPQDRQPHLTSNSTCKNSVRFPFYTKQFQFISLPLLSALTPCDENEKIGPAEPSLINYPFITEDGVGAGSGEGASRWTKFAIIPDDRPTGKATILFPGLVCRMEARRWEVTTTSLCQPHVHHFP